MLNKSKGNMYPWVTHTWNVIKGKCPHDCSYCYMKKWGEQNPLRFDKGELNTVLGSGNFIFVGSSCDPWANSIPDTWIRSMLGHCISQPDNKYLFQSKNPARFVNFEMPPTFMLGTTIETNRPYPKTISKALEVKLRYAIMASIEHYPKMVSIEPIMDFDLHEFIAWLKDINPLFVSIGANTNYKVKLPEPEPRKLEGLIAGLKEFTEVKVKDNLQRLNQAGVTGSPLDSEAIKP